MEITGEGRMEFVVLYSERRNKNKVFRRASQTIEITNRGSCRQNATDLITVRHFLEG